MLIGIDDTDSPRGMCTTYLGAVLAQRLEREGMHVREARLVRLNPNVTFKTRGNAAISLDVDGDPEKAFAFACAAVEELADFGCENTNPGVVVTTEPLDQAFYIRAVTDFCEIDEATAILDAAGSLYRGFGNHRGLIGATAAVAAGLEDRTYEILVYRMPDRWGRERIVDRASLFLAEEMTFPHTWDTVDRVNDLVVCVPHTSDPVLFGIRGEDPAWVTRSRQVVISEDPGIEQVWATNQGTDAHLITGEIGVLREGISYHLKGTVTEAPATGPGGHVSFAISDGSGSVRCMAFEPTKNFRSVVRQIIPGDDVIVAGSFKNGSINLEKIRIVLRATRTISRPPVCTHCGKRMTSDGRGKGFKCRKCGRRSGAPEVTEIPRSLSEGWYEVPPTARRHLAKPLCRGEPEF